MSTPVKDEIEMIAENPNEEGNEEFNQTGTTNQVRQQDEKSSSLLNQTFLIPNSELDDLSS